MTTQILIVFILIALNGFFALSEMSVVTSRKPRLKQMSGESRRAKAALELAEQPERFLSTVQVGITLIGILTGVFGGSAIGARIASWLTPLNLDPELAEGIGMAISVVLIAFFSIVLGELVPKRIALLAPERIATNVAMPMRTLGIVTMPFVWLLSHSTRLLLRLLHLDRGDESKVSEEEIRLLVAEGHEQGLIDADERAMMNRVMRLGDRTAESLMTPRNRIAWLDTKAPREENLEVLGEHPYSRYPVYRGSDSDVAGILEAKSLARLFAKGAQQFNLFADLKPPLFVSESTRAIALLEIFRDEGAHLALVVDEYGDLQGLVTLNDLLGAVLGQAALSQELETGPSDSPVIRRTDGSYLVDGSLSIEDLRELLELSELPGEEEHDYNTAAGMTIAHFSRIPAPGEAFEFGHWRIEVVDLDGARIDKLLICRVEDHGTEDIAA
ncbi:MAG: hemolysin family protein [Lysobacteraceae bacterium]